MMVILHGGFRRFGTETDSLTRGIEGRACPLNHRLREDVAYRTATASREVPTGDFSSSAVAQEFDTSDRVRMCAEEAWCPIRVCRVISWVSCSG